MTVPFNNGDYFDGAVFNRRLSKLGQLKGNITYNEDGLIDTIVDTLVTPNITYTYTYDDDLQVATETDGVTTWTFTRDEDGNITNIAES